MRRLGVAAALIAGTVDVLYLGYVSSQGAGDPQFLRVPLVALFIAVMAICAALSARQSAARWRPLLLGASAAGLLLLGYFAIFSIGLPLLVAGAFALVSLVGTLSLDGGPPAGSSKAAAAGMAAAGAVLAVVVLLAGFSLAERAIRCPASGSGPGLLGGSYEYSCNNGTLTISR
ncbi:MAG: hypothetical protein E6I25_04435 [Chloroflexi bacterium]|nr:MAG: hypothetical protein E6I25_04435 [Chloroflexota bacterium]